ncbi:YbaB/EbfC family DNA-binding protein [Nocardia sp. NPDC052566]|uniref:YbaB/EbfC family DNA-binding protein n=1 Tax=Nocardia sp. NPDC052566 TaxID=3364330 RepID=UPI0037C831FB
MIRPENQRAAGEAADLIDAVAGALDTLAEMRAGRDALTASATVEYGRITVVVNASGSIVRTVYAEGIDELGYGQIARATVQAAQAAAAEVERKKKELLGPLAAMRFGMPAAQDLPEELAALRAQLPEPTRASLEPPAERAAGKPRGGSNRIMDR